MSSEYDMSQYLDLFLQEANEQLEILEREVLILESEPSLERLQVIFRAAHTLKGSSRAMGFEGVAVLTHEMENLLDRLRNQELKVNSAIADALLACLDGLTQLISGLSSGEECGFNSEELATTLQTLSKGSSGDSVEKTLPANQDLSPEQSEELASATDATIFHAHFKLEDGCVMKFARAFMAVNVIEEGGELFLSIPDREHLEEENFESEFDLYFTHNSDLESLLGKFKAISEVESCTLEPWRSPISAKTEDPTALLPEAPAASAIVQDSPELIVTPSSAPTPKRADVSQTVRVDVNRLDTLMKLVGELVIDRTRISQIGADLASQYRNPHIDALAETVGHIARITGDLQEQIMKARMLPIDTIFNRFPRVVRDLAQKLNKQIELKIEGGETDLDRSVIEVIGDPVLHLLRNCIDHGIELPEHRKAAGKTEKGTIHLRARHQESHMVIEVEDDGKGIDVEKIRAKAIAAGLTQADRATHLSDREVLQFIFASGLSTAEVVSEVSGRGVGMDIVRQNLQTLGGFIDVESSPGRGSKFTLSLPLTLAIIRGLLVKIGSGIYVIPLTNVIETLQIPSSEIQKVRGQDVIVVRGTTTPLLDLASIFGVQSHRRDAEKESGFAIVIVRIAEQRIGLIVEELIGEQEVVIKSLDGFIGDVPGFSGSTILGDGNVALILDVSGLASAEKETTCVQ